MLESPEKTINRRHFLKLTSVSGGMLALGFSIPATGKAAVLEALDPARVLNLELSPFIMIDTAEKLPCSIPVPIWGRVLTRRFLRS